MSVIYDSEAIALSTALEDNVKQLSILGKIMPYSFVEQPDVLDILNGEVEEILINNMDIETRFHHVLSKYSNSKALTPSEAEVFKNQVKEVTGDLKNSVHVFSRTLNHNPLKSENIKKVQEDRLFLQEVLTITAKQLFDNGSFDHLVNIVENELTMKQQLQDVIKNEEESRRRTKELRKMIEEVKHQESEEIQNRNEMIAHLKDQLQETKAKTSMELKYTRARCDAQVAQTAKMCQQTEQNLHTELSCLDRMIDNEQRVHNETESWLRDYLDKIHVKTKHWTQKYEVDTETLKRNLTVLSNSKNKDLQRLKDLTMTYMQYEAVVINDRIEKEKLLRIKEKEALEIASSLKIQCWWRTVCVRQGLGPYGKKKRKGKKGGKGKKGKKSGKGKKKK